MRGVSEYRGIAEQESFPCETTKLVDAFFTVLIVPDGSDKDCFLFEMHLKFPSKLSPFQFHPSHEPLQQLRSNFLERSSIKKRFLRKVRAGK